MEAMTMPFKLKHEELLKEMAAGDRVTATLVVQGDRSRLEDVVFAREEIDPSASAATARAMEPAVGEEVPNFSLVNQNARAISLYQYRGRALVLTFIYTRCPLPDYCPLMTERFAEIDRALMAEPPLYERTRLLSISVDADYDKPDVLRAYGAEQTAGIGAADFSHWEFASGSKAEIKNIADYFGLEYWAEADQIIHSLRTAIISPDGKLVRLYRGNEWQAADILGELRAMGRD
jgi:protein SCO1/2